MLDSDEFQFRYDCGICKASSLITYADKPKVVEKMCLHYTILVSLAELEQLRRGLCFMKFNLLMESQRDLVSQAFCPPSAITAEFIQDMFTPMFSPRGNNRRDKEESIIMEWIHYLQEIEG